MMNTEINQALCGVRTATITRPQTESSAAKPAEGMRISEKSEGTLNLNPDGGWGPTRASSLLNRATDRRKHVVGVGTDEPDRADYYNQNHG
jgi:hypothetical protein